MIEEMTDGLAHHPAAFFNWPPDSATQARSSICTDCSISASVTISGAQEPHDIVAGADGRAASGRATR